MMLRLSFGLLVGLVAVSTLPLDDTTTKQPPSTTANTITLKDVENDQGIEVLRSILSICSMEKPASENERKSWENTLKETMESKNYLAFCDQFLANLTAIRNAECGPESDPNQFTGKNSDKYIMIAHVMFHGPDQKSSENNQESTLQGTHELQQNDLESNNLQCDRHYFEKDGKCYPGYGAPCQDDSGCAQQNLTCHQGICDCDGHYSGLSEICQRHPTKLHGFCHEALPCDKTENAQCSSKLLTCECKEHYVEQNGRCLAGEGASCRNDAECSAVPHLACTAEKCTLR